MAVATVGIDFTKNIFAIHGVEKIAMLFSTALPELIASLPPSAIGMDVCSGAHHWARLFSQYGHDDKLMAPSYRGVPGQNSRSASSPSLHPPPSGSIPFVLALPQFSQKP